MLYAPPSCAVWASSPLLCLRYEALHTIGLCLALQVSLLFACLPACLSPCPSPLLLQPSPATWASCSSCLCTRSPCATAQCSLSTGSTAAQPACTCAPTSPAAMQHWLAATRRCCGSCCCVRAASAKHGAAGCCCVMRPATAMQSACRRF